MGTWNCRSVRIGAVNAQGHLTIDKSQIAHLFNVDFELQYSPAMVGLFCDPILEWNERIATFTKPAGFWQRTNIEEFNMYEKNPTSNTFGGWNKKYYNATFDVPEIKAKVPKGTSQHSEKGMALREQITIDHLKRKATTIKCTILDTPGLGKGSGLPKTELRIIYFDIGIRGGGPRVTATQLLEFTAGEITMMKFLTPGLPKGSIIGVEPHLKIWRDDYGIRHQYR